MSKRFLLVVVAAALAAGVTAWLLAARGGDDGDGARFERDGQAHAPSAQLSAPTLEGVAAPATRAALPPWTLDVTVYGVDPAAAPPITVQVSSVGKAGVGEVVAERTLEPGTLRAELDVSAFRTANWSRALSASAQARGYFGGAAHVELPEAPDDRARGGRLACTVTLRRGALLRGRVLRPDGTPALACVEAGVAQGNAFGPSPPLYITLQAESDATGAFELLLDGAEPVHLHATEKWTRSSLPTSSCLVAGPFLARVGAVLDVGDLQLTEGLEQVVVVRGRVEPPDRVGASCRGTAEGDHRTSPCDEGLIGLLVEHRAGRAGSSEGEIVVPGLRPGTWLVGGSAPNWGCALGHEAAWSSEAFVVVPGPPVELDLRRALLRVRVRGAAGPIDRALVTIQGEHALAFTTDSAGHGAVVLRPRTRYRVRVDADEHVTWTGDALTAADGEEGTLEVDLSPGTPASRADVDWADHAQVSLTLAVKGENPEEHLPARFAVYAEDGTRLNLRWVQRSNVVTWLVTDRLLALGEAHCVDALPPGDLTFAAECDGFEPAHTVLRRGPLARGARNVSLTLRPR